MQEPKEKEIEVTIGQLYYMAAEEVMENMPFENKEFNPKDKDECVEMLMAIVEKKELSIEWIQSVASANLSNMHTLITLDNKWTWNYMGGMSKTKNTKEEFLDDLKDTLSKVDKGNFTINGQKKGKFGKEYFNKKEKK